MSTIKYAYAFLASTPMRAEATDRSEMVNVVLFGEAFEILESKPKWILIRLQHDRYEGWIDPQMCRSITEQEYEHIRNAPKYFSRSLHGAVSLGSGTPIAVTKGACFPGLEGSTLRIGNDVYQVDVALHESKKNRAALVATALDYLNTPYHWGGRSNHGIDCSGFTQMVYRMNGIFLPRDASQQAKKGTTLSFLEECQPGDLAYFDNADGAIVHVGIVLDNYQIIHASGRVRIDTIDHSGIYNDELGRHTHKLRVLKSLLD